MDGEKVDQVLLALGKLGRWQVLQGIWLSITYIPLAFQYTSIVFIGYEPEFRCDRNNSYRYDLTNVSDHWFSKDCGGGMDDPVNTSNHCGGHYEFREPSYISIVSEWNLVCDSGYLVQLSQTFLSAGLMIGNVLVPVSDRYGRKRTLVVCHWLMLLVCAAIAISPNIIFFICARFLLGLLFPAVNIIMCVMLLEIFAADQRASVTMLSKFLWAGGIMTLTLVAYVFRRTSWRYFQLSITTLSLLVIAHTFLLEESVRWLLSVNRKKDAIAVLKRAAQFNNISFKDKVAPLVEGVEFGSISVFQSLQDLAMVDRAKSRTKISLSLASVTGSSELNISRQNGMMANGDCPKEMYQKKEKPTGVDEKQGMLSPESNTDEMETAKISDLFRHATLRKNVLISSYILFVDIMLYYGLLLMSSSLAGDRFLNVMFSGAVEIPAYASCIFVLSWFGRKPCMLGFHLLSGSMLALTIVVNLINGPDLLVTAFATMGKFGICGALIVTFLHNSEIIPTNLRGLGVGFGGAVANIGGTLAPFSSYLVQFGVWIPGAVFTVCCGTVCFLIYFLPETRGRQLPQTLADLDQWDKPKKMADEIA